MLHAFGIDCPNALKDLHRTAKNALPFRKETDTLKAEDRKRNPLLFEKKEKNFVVIICNYSVCKVKGNESEMVHCLLCGMGYFNF